MYYYIRMTDLLSCDVDTLIRCSSIHPSDTTRFACIDETHGGCKAQLKEYITKIKSNLTTIYDGLEDPEEYAVCDGILEIPLEYENYIYRVHGFTHPVATYTKEKAIEEVKNRFTKLHAKIGKLLGKES